MNSNLKDKTLKKINDYIYLIFILLLHYLIQNICKFALQLL